MQARNLIGGSSVVVDWVGVRAMRNESFDIPITVATSDPDTAMRERVVTDTIQAAEILCGAGQTMAAARNTRRR